MAITSVQCKCDVLFEHLDFGYKRWSKAGINTMVKGVKSGKQGTKSVKRQTGKESGKQATKQVEKVTDTLAESGSEDSDIEGFQSASENEEELEEDEEDEEVSSGDDEVEIELKQGSHTIKQLDSSRQSKSDSSKKEKHAELSGILYVSRLPQEFKERELSKYFSQFGDLKQVRLARNKKTGNSRHYAFIEYINKDDAVVAQDSMNNYLLMGHLLKVKVLPKGSQIDKLFKYKKKPFLTSKVSKTADQLKQAASERHEQRISKLQDAGIDFKW